MAERFSRIFSLCFSAHSTCSTWTAHDLYNDNKSRGREKELFGAFTPWKGSVGQVVAPLYLDAVLGVEVGGAQTGIEAVAQALQQPHSWKQLTFVLNQAGGGSGCFSHLPLQGQPWPREPRPSAPTPLPTFPWLPRFCTL